ncbi:efflux RND transporter permease subunit [bacterium]|nr:efflux RND transporter permease subunit [bacterium]
MSNPIKYMAGNHVAANIFMLILIVGGLIMSSKIKQEVFPEFELDMISVVVAYPGASPAEIEDSIIRPLEQAVSGVDDIKRFTATASEGVGTLIVEIVEGSDANNILDKVKSEVDRIRIFPEDAEKAIVSRVTNRREVMTLVVYGDVSEHALNDYAERIRDDLLAKENITQVEISAVRPQEISIEISEENLRRYNLTLSQVAGIIRSSSLDMPGGTIKTIGGDVMIRTKEKKYVGAEFDSLAVFKGPNGARVTLGQIAEITDGFAEYDHEAVFNGKPAAMIEVYRVGEQTPKDIASTVKDYIAELQPQLPSSVNLEIIRDRSEFLQDRIDLLLTNGSIGIVLVFIILALFLEIRLAIWVAVGMVISFLGAMLFMPSFDVSINMLSLFAFIVVLGIVVDDAIVVGENIFVHRRMGKSHSQSVVDGAQEIARAVIFAVLTTMAAFAPLLFVSGMMGKFFWVVPVIVITVIGLSLFESLFILPAHLSGNFVKSKAEIWVKIENQRKKFDILLNWVRDKTYAKTLEWVIKNRYITVAIAVAGLLISIGIVSSGLIKFVFMPQIEADHITMNLTMMPGTPYNDTKRAVEIIERKGLNLVAEYDSLRGDGKSEALSVFKTIGSQSGGGMGPFGSSGSSSGNTAELRFTFIPSNERTIDLKEFTMKWRKRIGDVPGVETISMRSGMVGSDADIDIQLAHDEYQVLLEAVERVKMNLSNYAGVTEINDSYSQGKRELELHLKPEAASLGVTETDLGMQIRSAFYGAEAVRLQRGSNEVKVMVRYPEDERRSMAAIENMMIRTPSGGEIPFMQAAYIVDSEGFSVINRTDRKRVVNVTAKVDDKVTNADEVLSVMKTGFLKEIKAGYPGLSFDFEGTARDRKESLSSLFLGYFIAMFVIYALLAIPFNSFTQPFIVMSAIPFGIIGAIGGLILMGYNLSLIAAMGIVALSGIVVNDSLVMIDFINRARESGVPFRQAVLESGVRRFRPIIMTSLTTFFGLMPMIFETSRQARFMIPMAVSLGFGVLFSTAITLVLIPALYMIFEDFNGNSSDTPE